MVNELQAAHIGMCVLSIQKSAAFSKVAHASWLKNDIGSSCVLKPYFLFYCPISCSGTEKNESRNYKKRIEWIEKKKQDKAKHYNKFQSWFHLINHIRNIFMVNNINSMISASLKISHIYFMLHLDKVNKSEKLRIVLFGFKAQLTKNIL